MKNFHFRSRNPLAFVLVLSFLMWHFFIDRPKNLASEAPKPPVSSQSFPIAVIGLLTAVWVLTASARVKRIAKLVSSGRRVEATVIEAYQHFGGGIRTRHGHARFYIHCQWQDPDTGEVHKFDSDLFSDNPLSKARAGEKVTVYLEPNNFKSYFVDLKSIGSSAA